MKVSFISQQLMLRSTNERLNESLAKARMQSTSTKLSDTYSGYDVNAGVLLSMRNEVRAIDQFSSSVKTAQMRTTVMQSALERVQDAGSTTAIEAMKTPNMAQMRKELPGVAAARLGTVVSALNTQMVDRFPFSGEQRDIPPLADPTDILAELKKQIENRHSADMVDSPTPGRIATATAGSVLTISKDATGFTSAANFDEFGFKLVDLTVDGVAATATAAGGAAAGAIGQAEFSFDFAATAVNAKVSLKLGMPDGTLRTLDFTYTSVTQLESDIDAALTETAATDLIGVSQRRAASNMFDYAPPTPTSRFAVPSYTDLSGGAPALVADTNNAMTHWYNGQTFPLNAPPVTNGMGTAANDLVNGTKGDDLLYGAAGDDTIEGGEGHGDMAVFSGNAAAYTFYDLGGGRIMVSGPDGNDVVRNVESLRFSDGDQAVSGLTFAVGTPPATSAPSAADFAADRSSTRVRVDKQLSIDYGVRADESGIKETVKGLALFATLQESDYKDLDTYSTHITIVAESLRAGSEGVISTRASIGIREEQFKLILDRHDRTRAALEQQVGHIENVDMYEAITRVNTLETQLQASYQVTTRMMNLSLVNYMN